MSMKKSSDTIGNRTNDLPVCSAVPQPLYHHMPGWVTKASIKYYEVCLKFHCITYKNIMNLSDVVIIQSTQYWETTSLIYVTPVIKRLEKKTSQVKVKAVGTEHEESITNHYILCAN
jgi:hypothetical protein